MATRKKVSEETAKLRASERAATRREAKRIEETNRQEVVRLLSMNEHHVEKVMTMTDKNMKSSEVANALSYVIAQRTQKVITSFAVNPKVSVSVSRYSTGRDIEAVTDFTNIEVTLSPDAFSHIDIDKTASTLMALKGAIYHEAGHILCTMPFNALFDCALLERGWYPLTVPNRYYSTDNDHLNAIIEAFPAYEQEIRNGLTYSVTVEDMPDDVSKYALSVARDKTKFEKDWCEQQHMSRLTAIRDELKSAWGILEDGRMEDQMSRSNPVMEDYFKTLVLNFLVSSEVPGYSWPGVVTRTHLGDDLIDSMREFAYQYVESEGKSRDLVDRIENQIHVYRQSKTIHEAISAISTMQGLLTEWRPKNPETEYNETRENPTMGNDHRSPGSYYGTSTVVTDKPDFGDPSKGWENSIEDNDSDQEGGGQDVDQTNKASSGATTMTDEDGTKSDDSPDNNSGESSEEADSEKESDASGSKGTGGVVKNNVDYEDLRRKMREMHNEYSEKLVSVDDATKFIAEVNNELRLDVPHNSATTQMSSKVLARAKEVENGMLNALEPLAVTADPQWRFRQEDGVLDPTTYKLKEPGDTDYWLDYEGEGAHGHDLAVSVLLDTSSSMGEWMDELSAGAYGIRKACESLDIPCTVSTFDTQAYLLWDSDEEAQALQVHDGGGTNPLDSLRQIKNQNAGKTKHLIVVLTDGQWSGVNSVIPFIQPNQHWVLIGLSYSEDYALNLVNKKGGHVAIGITNVADLPKQVELALTGFLA